METLLSCMFCCSSVAGPDRFLPSKGGWIPENPFLSFSVSSKAGHSRFLMGYWMSRSEIRTSASSSADPPYAPLPFVPPPASYCPNFDSDVISPTSPVLELGPPLRNTPFLFFCPDILRFWTRGCSPTETLFLGCSLQTNDLTWPRWACPDTAYFFYHSVYKVVRRVWIGPSLIPCSTRFAVSGSSFPSWTTTMRQAHVRQQIVFSHSLSPF